MSFPIRINASTDLQVEVFLHEFFLGDRNRKCWTYITKGLTAFGQKEMSLSLLLEDDDDEDSFPKTPVKIFQLLEKSARGGKAANIADSTRLGSTGFYGFAAVYYLDAIQYEDLPDLTDHLSLMLVHQSEYEFAKKYGFTRLLSRIGKFCSSFPYPTWNSRHRPSLFEEKPSEVTILENIRSLTFKNNTAELVGNQVVLTIDPLDRDQLLGSLRKLESSPFALNTSLSLNVNAALSWEPGQEKPGAYTAPDEVTHIGAAFVQFESAATTSSNLVEDGFSFRLSPETLAVFCTLLNEKRDNEVLDTGSFQLQVKWLQPQVGNRKPAVAYHHLAAWTTLDDSGLAETEIADSQKESDLSETEHNDAQIEGQEKVVLSKMADVTMNASKRVASNQLNEYIESIKSFLASAMQEESDKISLTIRTTIERKKAKHVIDADIQLNPEFIEFMENGLARILPCYTASPLTFELSFTVNP
jgi:hypothetical protein